MKSYLTEFYPRIYRTKYHVILESATNRRWVLSSTLR